jgi:hypothetical protein
VKQFSDQLGLGFDFAPTAVTVDNVMAPTGYTGLSAFHKYWGKKPIECLGYLIEKLTTDDDVVLDPFVGSGLIARECAIRNRRFIGIDINPVSIELARMVTDLPSAKQYADALQSMEQTVRSAIDESYLLHDGVTASHYLWDNDKLKEIWIARKGKGGREVRTPLAHDYDLSATYKDYNSILVRPIQLFQNSRINTSPALTLSDIFTGRALRNIDLLIESIPEASENLRRALLLTLTASIGQMSSMVFAITGRGKNKGEESAKIEVGSWVIGYWRPPMHFEINVWNCFQRRATKLLKALSEIEEPRSFSVSDTVDDVVSGVATVALLNQSSLSALQDIPDDSVALVLTDPPHSDRIPYLELSELWNAILGKEVSFADEIVVSNARERGKTKLKYNEQITLILDEINRVLVPGGTLALLFNAKDAESWNSLVQRKARASLQYYGCFPMSYSANSIVQDSREGAMKSDYVLIYRKTGNRLNGRGLEKFVHTIPGWSAEFPKLKEKRDVILV